MKTLKKIIGLAMAMVMMAMSFAAYAETTEEHIHDGCCGETVQTTADEGIMPRAEICSCGTIMTKIIKEYPSYTINVSCTHGAAGYDTIRVTPYYYDYKCSNCGNYIHGPLATTSETLLYCPKQG